MTPPSITLRLAGILLLQCFHAGFSSPPAHFSPKDGRLHECEHILTSDNGLIATDNWPSFFAPGYKCRWVRTLDTAGELTIIPVYLDFNESGSASACPDENFIEISVSVPDTLNTPEYRRAWNCRNLHTGLGSELKETPAEEEGIPTDNSPSRIIRANNQVHQHGFLMSPNFPHPHNKLVLLKWTFHGFWNILFYLAEFDVGSCEDFDAHVLRLEIRKSGMDRPELMKTWCGNVPKGDRHKWVTGLMSEQPIYLTYAQRRDKGEQPWAPSFSNTAHVTHKGFLLTWIGLKDPNLHSNAVRLLSGEDEHQTVNNTEKDPRDIYFVFIPSENGNAVVTSMLTDNDATTCGAELMEYYIYWRPACYVMFNCSRDTDPRYKHHIYWKEQWNDLFNAALGKPTVFSVSGHRPGKDSTKDNLTSDLVVDGKAVDGYEDLKSGKVCAQTVVDSKRSNKTMWYVDLGKVYRVHWIHIVSRRNVSNNHMKLFYVELTRTVTELNQIQRPPPANITCFTHRDKRATSDIWISCPHDTQLARYVGITFYRRTGNMQLCEVEVQVPRDPEEDPDEDEVDLNNTTPEIRTVSFVTDGNIEGTGFKLWYRVTLLSVGFASWRLNLVKVNTVRINDRDVNETGDENPNSAPDCLGNMLLLGSNRRYRMFCGDHFGAEGLLLNLTGDGGTDTSRLRWIRRQKPSHAPYRLIPQNKTVDIEYFHTPDCGGEVKVHRDLSKVWNISSPMYPLFVPPLLNCTWRIVPDFKGFIRMDVVDDDFDETGKKCGGPLSNQTTLTSTGYPQRQHAPDEDRDCVWTFYTDDQYGVFHVTLTNIGFPMRSGKCVDYVEVKLSSPIRGHPANKGAEKRWCGSVKRQTYT
ncbi:hypothetical protein BaRGS_00033019, partial [Batillaria attramentaria]